MNRRNWLKKSAGFGATAALTAYIPYVLPNHRPLIPNEIEYLRLHWNENPYGASPKALAQAAEMLKESNHYPDDQIEALSKSLAEKYGLIPDQVMITAGSTEVLCLLGQKVASEKKEVLTSEQSFPTLAIFANRHGAKINSVPVRSDERIDLPALFKAVNEKTGLIFLCNPNNPTSTDHDKASLVSFIERVPSHITICVDEAYIQYSRDGEKGSLIDMIKNHENVLICRTFSKAYGLAGMRVGFALGGSSLIEKLRSMDHGLGMATSNVAVSAARAALADDAHIEMVVSQNEKGRKIVYNAFDEWGISYAQSATNFIYARCEKFAPDIRERLREEGILITKWPNMTRHIRISVGRPEWMEQFVGAAKKYVI